MHDSDIELLQKWSLNRDAEAFREILARHTNMVFATSKRILGDTAAAEDAVQECFLRLAEKNVKIRESLAGWLHSVATRCALVHLRSERRRKQREEAYVIKSPPRSNPDCLDWQIVKHRVDEAIEALPEKLRYPIIKHRT